MARFVVRVIVIRVFCWRVNRIGHRISMHRSGIKFIDSDDELAGKDEDLTALELYMQAILRFLAADNPITDHAA